MPTFFVMLSSDDVIFSYDTMMLAIWLSSLFCCHIVTLRFTIVTDIIIRLSMIFSFH